MSVFWRLDGTNFMKIALFVLGLSFVYVSWAQESEAYKQAFSAYQEGRYMEAHRLLTPLAEQGEVQAQLALSLLYEKGLGVEANAESALKWYEKAALQGDPVIQYELGLKYFNGENIDVDYDKAATWWLKSASQEHAGAQYNLALMYIKGNGFDKNMRMAVEWLNKAALKDYAPAHYSLGVIHATGNGVERSFARAFEHFSIAAPMGIVEAQYNLGVCYEKGRGTPINLERARQWYELAAKQDFAKAKQKLKQFAQHTKTDQLKTATDGVADESKLRQDDPYKWLGKQYPPSYTLQLIALSNQQAVERFIDTYQIPSPNAYYTIRRDGREIYRVVYGAFSLKSEAESARVKIVEQHADLAPVIVQFASIHQQLKRR